MKSIRNPYPTQSNFIGQSMTTQPSVLQPSSILPPLSSHCAVIWRAFQIFFLLFFF